MPVSGGRVGFHQGSRENNIPGFFEAGYMSYIPVYSLSIAIVVCREERENRRSAFERYRILLFYITGVSIFVPVTRRKTRILHSSLVSPLCFKPGPGIKYPDRGNS